MPMLLPSFSLHTVQKYVTEGEPGNETKEYISKYMIIVSVTVVFFH